MTFGRLEKDALMTDLHDFYKEMVSLIRDYGFEYDEKEVDEDDEYECFDDPEICRLRIAVKELQKVLEDNI